MDNHTSLNINVDGSLFVPGEPMKPRTFTITMQGEPPKNVISQEEIQRRRNDKANKQGQFAWAKLHSYTGCDPQWLDLWQFFIPQRCDCKDGYQKILEETPPDFTSPEAFFAWGVALHNAINRKLGKPELTIDEARKTWRQNDGCSQNSGSNLP